MKFRLFQLSLLSFLIAFLIPSHSQENTLDLTRFSVTEVITNKTGDNQLQLLSRFKLSLSPTAYDAIDHGVPIDIVIEFAKPNSILWWTRYQPLEKTKFRLTRQALSNNYQLENLTTVRTLQFITIDEALQHIATFQITQIDNVVIDHIAVRIYLDVFNLPAQIRASAFFSSRWRHDSAWTIWQVS